MKFYEIHPYAFPRPISFEALPAAEKQKYGIANARTLWHFQKLIIQGLSLEAAAEQIGIPPDVVTRYFANHPEKKSLFSAVQQWKERNHGRLIDFIEQRGGTVRVRDLMQSYAPLKNKRSKAEQILAQLIEAGIGEWVEGAHGVRGRPARKFRLFSTSKP